MTAINHSSWNPPFVAANNRSLSPVFRVCGCLAIVFAVAMPAAAADPDVIEARSLAIFERLESAVATPAAAFAWDLRVTNDPAVTAFATGNGRIVIGRAYVERLRLQDTELAMLIAHEMGHIVAGHRRAMPKASDGEGDPAGELQRSAVAIAQEDEADMIGLRIALQAGWRRDALIVFFEKLAADTAPGEFSSTHPSAVHRLERMREAAPR